MKHGFLALILLLAACGRAAPWHATDIAGVMPRLEFAMTRANDGARVTAADYRGKVVLLYFGYTNCPDICPTTLANLADMLGRLGPAASDVRVLFVSVDPGRDTPDVLARYVKAFAPQIDGLRGDANAVAALARRYRIAYSVTKGPDGTTAVTHTSAVFFFDAKGDARLVTTSTDDAAGLAQDVKRLLD